MPYPPAPVGAPNSYNNPPVNPLDEKKDEIKPAEVIYTPEDREYLSFLQLRLETAKRQKDQIYPEFNNKTYYQYYEENERIANTHQLDGKKNDDDVIVSAGTIEQKLDALLSHINNMNLSVEVEAFDRENNRVSELSLALEDIIHQTEILDGADGGGDEEKKVIRQRELLKQGTVFVQEEWLRKFETKKKLKKKFDGKFKQEADYYASSLELVFEGPSRTLLHGPNVFLGDITEFYMENQPFAFVMVHQDYDVAKGIFNKFENWEYVKPGAVPSDTVDTARTVFDNKWRLTELKANQVEILYYQDPTRDEFQILINGVCMLPIGFPLSAVSPKGGFNIAKQVCRVINAKFTYGGAFVASGSVKEVSALIDEMLRLFVLKTRKSFTPAYVNTSGRVIDKKVLSPGRISMGFDASVLQPIAGNEVQGVTAGELGVFTKMQELVDKSTVSDQFQGQQGQRGMTATEVVELQRQARLTLGLIITACALLEKKLGYLRLWNILANWFEPTGTRVVELEDARKMISTFRKTNREVNIDGEGMGERMVIPTDEELPSPEVIRAMEHKDEAEKGYPVRKVYINRTGLANARLIWQIIVIPKERESSSFFKLMFREQITDMISLMQLGSIPNKDGLEEEYARVYGKSRNKLFSKGATPDMAGVSSAAAPGMAGAARGRPNPAGVPQLPGNMGMGGVA